MININVYTVTRLTRMALSVFLAKKTKGKKGAVINIGSGAATVLPADPLYPVYAGTKAYVDQFTRCLHEEYKAKGVDFQLQVRWRGVKGGEGEGGG
jgi:17beta-estradiol 17-dehydrogenase / very-long-chain 3-oxoacyl-CoA reductase